MIDLYLPPKPAIIIPREREIIRLPFVLGLGAAGACLKGAAGNQGPTQTQISGGVGSWSGSMSGAGGIAAAHDGNLSQTGGGAGTASRSANANTVLATIRINWGAPKKISRFQLYPPSDVTMWDAGTGTIGFRGSTDNFSSSDVGLYSATGVAEPGAGGSPIDVNQRTGASLDVSNAYQYHELRLTSSTGRPNISESVLWEEI